MACRRSRSLTELDAQQTGVDTVGATAVTGTVVAVADGTRPRAPLSAETRRLYAADWSAFAAWCRREGQTTLPAQPATLVRYLASQAVTLRSGTLARRAVAIADRHRRAGFASPAADPEVRAVLRGVRRSIAADRQDQRSIGRGARTRNPASAAQLARMAARCPGDLAGLRDRALLLLTAAGFGGERLLALDREHVRLSSQQLELTLSDADAGAGAMVVLERSTSWATCPVRALDHWLQSSDTRFGPVFRKVDRWGNVEHRRMGADALRRIWRRRAAVVRAARSPRPAADTKQ